MTNIFLGNVHVINLEKSKDRLQNIDANLKKFGIKYQRFNAVEGQKLSLKDINDNVTTKCRYLSCTKSMIGNAMSHIAIWKEIMVSESSDKWHLILEDDAEFTDETINFLNKLSNTSIINENDIIINLACPGIFCRIGPSVIVNTFPDNKKNDTLLVKPMYPSSTAAYLITKNTAKKLYDYFIKNKIDGFGDMQIALNFSEIGINYYATRNKVINLSSDSINSTTGSGYKPLFLLNKILKYFLGSQVTWLEYPRFAFNLTVPITGYVFIFLILLALNLVFFGSILIYIYLLLELTITIILSLTY